MSNNLTSNINLFQPTGFSVIIDRQNYANMTFFVQSINHPGADLPPVEVPFRTVQNVPFPGSALQYGELTMNILIDEDMKSYTEMYDWILRLKDEGLVQRDNFGGVSSSTPSYADITVIARNSSNNKTKTFKYTDCLPTRLGDIQFEAQNQSVEFLTYSASFRFTKFDIV
jgi:hypothetical protein